MTLKTRRENIVTGSKECCDEIHKDDGRQDDGQERRKNDWGNHGKSDNKQEEYEREE